MPISIAMPTMDRRGACLGRNLQDHHLEGDSGMLVFLTFMPLALWSAGSAARWRSA